MKRGSYVVTHSEQHERVLALLTQGGQTNVQIAREAECSRAFVSWVAKKHGITPFRRQPRGHRGVSPNVSMHLGKDELALLEKLTRQYSMTKVALFRCLLADLDANPRQLKELP